MITSPDWAALASAAAASQGLGSAVVSVPAARSPLTTSGTTGANGGGPTVHLQFNPGTTKACAVIRLAVTAAAVGVLPVNPENVKRVPGTKIASEAPSKSCSTDVNNALY